MLKSITPIQWLGIIILFNTTLIGGSSLLPDLFLSPKAVSAILAVATLGNGFLGGLVTMFGGPIAMKTVVGNMEYTTVVTDPKSAAKSTSKYVVPVTPAIIEALKK